MTILPEVSVLIPILNAVNDIKGCVTALRSQDYPAEKLEIIIVDNGSKDGSLELLKSSGVRVLSCPARGRSRALNFGLLHSRGEIICTTDISCRPSPGWVSTVVRVFNHPRVGCVAGDILQDDEIINSAMEFQARIGYMSPMHAQMRQSLPYLPYADGANASFRKSVFDEIGPFAEAFFKAADVEICYRMLMMSEYLIAFCKEALVTEAAEPSMRDLLKQRYRIGLGARLLMARFPNLYARNNVQGTPLKRFVWRISEDFNEFRNRTLADFTRSILMRCCESFGRFRGRSTVPLELAPISEKIELEFLENYSAFDQRVLRSEEVSTFLHDIP